MSQPGCEVLVDANVLWGNNLRDLVIQLDEDKLIRLRATARVLDEVFEGLERRSKLDPERLRRTRSMVEQALTEDSFIYGYELLEPTLSLPDANDRHVLAACISANVPFIATFNGRDFPSASLAPHAVEAIHPDDWLCHVFDRDSTAFLCSLETMLARRKREPCSVRSFAQFLGQRAGMPKLAERLMDTLNWPVTEGITAQEDS